MVLDLIQALIQKQQQSDEADRFLIRENQRVIERKLEEIMRENVRLRDTMTSISQNQRFMTQKLNQVEAVDE
ncbi:hypothetical protein L484_009578 [Morus notabilis]|uniref:Uncharacterized protein n=1 Tax=Morus notabilis TaxID=981085 RepID=W9QBW4_9ROSA|nr:hypothetical protein L484_009578 [Morus notabilis]